MTSHVFMQVVNLVTNRVSRIIGKVENTERFLRIALYQGVPKKGVKTSTKLPTNADSRTPVRDPTLLCCAFQKQRLYLFTTREPDDTDQAGAGRCAPHANPNIQGQTACLMAHIEVGVRVC